MGIFFNVLVLIVLSLLLIMCVYIDAKVNNVDVLVLRNVEHIQELKSTITKEFQNQPDVNSKSLHVWAKGLPSNVRYHLNSVASEVQEYLQKKYNSNVFYLHDMTEINASSTVGSKSDKIYFTRHFDAPFAVLPCQILRVLVAINGTPDTSTIFNNKEVVLQTGQAAIFDYDRASHYIKVSTSHGRVAPRITAKMQFYIPHTNQTYTGKKVDNNWCINIHEKWGIYSREQLVQGQNSASWKVHVGIVATYIATFMKYVALLCILVFLLHIATNHKVFLIMFSVLITYIACYYIFVLYLLIRFTQG